MRARSVVATWSSSVGEQGAVPVDGARQPAREVDLASSSRAPCRARDASRYWSWISPAASPRIVGLDVRRRTPRTPRRRSRAPCSGASSLKLNAIPPGLLGRRLDVVEPVGECEVGVDHVVDVQVVAHERAVAADHGLLTPQQRADGAGHDAAPVEVAAAVHVAAAGDRRPGVRTSWRTTARGGRSHDFETSYGAAPVQRRRLRVRADRPTVAVGLVARGDDDATHDVGRTAAGVEQEVRAADVRLEGRRPGRDARHRPGSAPRDGTRCRPRGRRWRAR